MNKHLHMKEMEQQRAAWQAQLDGISRRPLSFCPDFPALAQRWEAWWRFEADRPLLAAAVRKLEAPRWDKAFDLLEKPEEWLAVRRRQMEATCFSPDTPPSIRVDLGPVVTAAFLGAPLHFAAGENTSWQTPVIRSWEGCPELKLRMDNHWLDVVLKLLDRTAQDAAGHYLVSLPDYSGAFDILANLRGSQDLLLDLYDAPDAAFHAAGGLVDAWRLVFEKSYATILARGAGITSWLHAWSSVAYTVPSCDFNYMIGPDVFRELVMPSLAEQARQAGRCVLHLDGPGATRHAQAVAEEPAITAVQFTPGAGSRSAVVWMDMYRLLQAAGKPLLLVCPKAEIPELLEKLDHRGLVLWPDDISTPREVDDIMALLGKR